ncbi:MAG: glycosyltransferase [Parcubacteria group bacterium]|nr:glycosyltransferase [Parcubacteria group bacterium]
MNLVVFNMSNVFDWRRGVVNRNFFVVRELLRSGKFEKVLLVDFLAVRCVGRSFGLRRTARYWRDCLLPLKGKRRLSARHVIWNGEKVFGVGQPVPVFSGFGVTGSWRVDLALVQKAMQEQGMDPAQTVVWSYNAFLPQALELAHSQTVFDAVDDWSLHASYKKEAAMLRQNYQRIGELAARIFTVSQGLVNNFPAGKAQWVPNGVDLDAFAKPNSPAPEIKPLPKPIIGYIGTVQERLDFKLLQTVCRRHQDKSFVFIGPVWGGVQAEANQLKQTCPNVFFLGRRPYNDVPAYLAAMDAAMIPHRLDSFLSTTNPMKMYDYLAAGKAVVSTPGAGTEQFTEQMYISADEEAFSAALDRALKEDSEERRRQRRQAVQAHTWKARTDKMLTLL